jgi:hypothetical protein
MLKGSTYVNVVSIDLKQQMGAKGDGVSDDSASLVAAINQVNTNYTNKISSIITVPPGSYLIKSNAIPAFSPGVPGAIYGAGPHRTYFQLDSSYVGDLFSWSESWISTAYVSGMTGAQDKAGPQAKGFTVLGNTSAGSQQNVFRFYDRNDHVLMEDVEAYFINGQFLSCGRTLNQSIGFMRESHFRNLKAFNCGTVSQPVIELSSTTTVSSDATNELQFHGLNLFGAKGKGIVINNPNSFNSTRLIKMFGVRIEAGGDDGISIGLVTDTGQTSNIGIHGWELSSGLINTYGLAVNTNGSFVPYGIYVNDGVINTLGSGINLQRCNGLQIILSSMNVGQNTVTTTANALNYIVSGPNTTYSHNP